MHVTLTSNNQLYFLKKKTINRDRCFLLRILNKLLFAGIMMEQLNCLK